MAQGNQDVLAGSMFVAFGVAALVFGSELQMGIASDMGSGYFPKVLAAGLVLVGAIIAWSGSRAAPPQQPAAIWSLRACLFICAAFVLFSVAIEWAGLLLTAPACMLLASLSTDRFRFRQQILLAAVATAAGAAIFIWGLELPISLLPVW